MFPIYVILFYIYIVKNVRFVMEFKRIFYINRRINIILYTLHDKN